MAASDEERRIEEIRAWFDEEGYDLFVHEVPGHGWIAPFMPKGLRIGSSDYGVGATALVAVEDARSRHLSGSRIVYSQDKGTATERAVVVRVEGAAAAAATATPPKLLGDPQVVARDIETLEMYGWVVSFTDEPDGKVTGYLLDQDSKAVLKSVTGQDHEDAWLGLGIDTMPPSKELRREREERRRRGRTV